MRMTARTLVAALLAATLAGCQTGQQARESYGPVETWPSYQAMQSLGHGD